MSYHPRLPPTRRAVARLRPSQSSIPGVGAWVVALHTGYQGGTEGGDMVGCCDSGDQGYRWSAVALVQKVVCRSLLMK